MRALQIISGVAVFGVVFSGILSYQEVFGSSITVYPSPGSPGTAFGYPACVYGFFMYLVVSTVALWGLIAGRNPTGGSSSADACRTPITRHGQSQFEDCRAP